MQFSNDPIQRVAEIGKIRFRQLKDSETLLAFGELLTDERDSSQAGVEDPFAGFFGQKATPKTIAQIAEERLIRAGVPATETTADAFRFWLTSYGNPRVATVVVRLIQETKWPETVKILEQTLSGLAALDASLMPWWASVNEHWVQQVLRTSTKTPIQARWINELFVSEATRPLVSAYLMGLSNPAWTDSEAMELTALMVSWDRPEVRRWPPAGVSWPWFVAFQAIWDSSLVESAKEALTDLHTARRVIEVLKPKDYLEHYPIEVAVQAAQSGPGPLTHWPVTKAGELALNTIVRRWKGEPSPSTVAALDRLLELNKLQCKAHVGEQLDQLPITPSRWAELVKNEVPGAAQSLVEMILSTNQTGLFQPAIDVLGPEELRIIVERVLCLAEEAPWEETVLKGGVAVRRKAGVVMDHMHDWVKRAGGADLAERWEAVRPVIGG